MNLLVRIRSLASCKCLGDHLFILFFLFCLKIRPIWLFFIFFFFNDTATTEIYPLSLHDALPIWLCGSSATCRAKALHLLPRDWLSWVCRKLLLSGGKRYRRRRCRSFCNDPPAGHGGWRRCNTIGGEIGKTHLLTPLTTSSPIPSS